jgi:pyroglutamyl-peptidase
MKTILLTGFEPFGGARVNPSQEIVRRLDGAVIAGHRVVGAVLPCVFGGAIRELRRRLRATRPVLVICTGQADGRAEITPERVAINVNDARMPDNAGRKPTDTPVVRGGPAAYWSTLPVKAIVQALKRRGIPASVSSTAGTFVCNHVFYALMHELAQQEKGARRLRSGHHAVRGGFIHVPLLPEQAGRGRQGRAAGTPPSLPLKLMVKALTGAVKASLRYGRSRRA